MEQYSLRYYYYYYSRLIEITYSTIVAPPSNPARSDRLHPCIRCLSFGNRVGQRFQANEAGLRRHEARSRFSIKIRYSLVTVTRFAASRLRNARVCVCAFQATSCEKEEERNRRMSFLSNRIKLEISPVDRHSGWNGDENDTEWKLDISIVERLFVD